MRIAQEEHEKVNAELREKWANEERIEKKKRRAGVFTAILVLVRRHPPGSHRYRWLCWLCI